MDKLDKEYGQLKIRLSELTEDLTEIKCLSRRQ